ncbi:unnamed protein product [Gordionus sp. m RMFG-2023]
MNPLIFNKLKQIIFKTIFTKISFTDKIQPARLPNNDVNNLSNDAYCCVAGWGKTGGYGNENALNQACIDYIDTITCNSSNIYNGHLTNNMFCAGFAEGGTDSCSGDSGGPLMCLESDWLLTGITSWGESCGTKPGVYTKVSNFYKWITSKISTN